MSNPKKQASLPEPYWTDGRGRAIFLGDVLDVLPMLPDESVNCCVTSPPYWGLRDYGTAEWEGGDEGCDHVRKNARNDAGGEFRPGREEPTKVQYGQECGKCGAHRIDAQLGLEATPEEYVEKMVVVFREVRRVLREDGTLWLNLGMSYFGSGGAGGDYAEGGLKAGQPKYKGTAKLSRGSDRLEQNASACGTDGTGRLSWQAIGRAYRHSGDGHQGDSLNHHGCTARTAPGLPEAGVPPLPTGHDNEPLDCGEASPPASLPDVPESNTHASSRRVQGVCTPSATALPCPLARLTSAPDVHPSSDTVACTTDTESTTQPLASHRSDKESSCVACGHSPSKGLCGKCWAYYTISSLGFKAKDEVNVPHLVAMALQADGWYLRQTIIWHKPNPMPESVTDRCTKAHEYIFLLAKSAKYYFDIEPIREAPKPGNTGSVRSPKYGADRPKVGAREMNEVKYADIKGANKRSVWTINTQPYAGAHFAVFPSALIKPCVLAGCPQGGTVLDPFMGSGTTLRVAKDMDRSCIGIELKEEYCEIAVNRLQAPPKPMGFFRNTPRRQKHEQPQEESFGLGR